MTREGVQAWLDAYVSAWRSYDREAIADLFSADASYRYHPYDEPERGREAIVEAWLSPEARDEPDTYEARYEPVAVDGDTAVAIGTSTYFGADGSVEKVYDNCFVMRFDAEGRCRDFTEWFMERPGR
jgi:uncharacterized protein (TIGR02246 family)